MAVTTAKQAEGEEERAFGRRLHRLAIKAGNVVAKRDLKTSYLGGLPPFVQSALRMHFTPDMTFENSQRLAHNLGISHSTAGSLWESTVGGNPTVESQSDFTQISVGDKSAVIPLRVCSCRGFRDRRTGRAALLPLPSLSRVG
jgi:hypothetical protein